MLPLLHSQVDEICQAQNLGKQHHWMPQAEEKHLKVAHGIQVRCKRKAAEHRPEESNWRVPHEVQGEVDQDTSAQRCQSYVPGVKGGSSQQEKKQEGVGEDPSHIRSAVDDLPQGLVDDIREHRANGHKEQVGPRYKAGCCQGQPQVGKEEHPEFIPRALLKVFFERGPLMGADDGNLWYLCYLLLFRI
jgi:hypothetical protein